MKNGTLLNRREFLGAGVCAAFCMLAGQGMGQEGFATSGNNAGFAVSGKKTGAVHIKEDLNTPKGREVFLSNHFNFKGTAEEQKELYDGFLAVAETNIGREVLKNLPQNKIDVSIVPNLTFKKIVQKRGFFGLMYSAEEDAPAIGLTNHKDGKIWINFRPQAAKHVYIHEAFHAVLFLCGYDKTTQEPLCEKVHNEFIEERKRKAQGDVLPPEKCFWTIPNNFVESYVNKITYNYQRGIQFVTNVLYRGMAG